jgi:hypothetical protein
MVGMGNALCPPGVLNPNLPQHIWFWLISAYKLFDEMAARDFKFDD